MNSSCNGRLSVLRVIPIIALCLQASRPLLAEDGKSAVRVEVRSVDELVWKDARIELFQQDKKTRVDVTFRNSVATGVPYGSYILRVFLPGFRKHEQTLGVNEPEVFVRVYLAIAHIEDGGETAQVWSHSSYYGQCTPLLQRPVAGLENVFSFPVLVCSAETWGGPIANRPAGS